MADIKSQVEAGLDKWIEHFNSGNAAAVADLYTEDSRWLPPGGQIASGKKAVEQAIQQLYDKGWVKITRDEAEYQSMEPNFGFGGGKWSFYDKDGKVVGKIKDITIWKKVDETWKIFRDIFNERV